MKIKGHLVKGKVIDQETRCEHYHTPVDIIAIKFYCCDTYYPCYKCHEEKGCGKTKTWPKKLFHEKAILCGSCGTELTIQSYLTGSNSCPACKATFNPNCQLHEHLYFSV